MRLVVATVVLMIVLALGALEIFAARAVTDIDASGVSDAYIWQAR
jgi:hypothetical protein